MIYAPSNNFYALHFSQEKRKGRDVAWRPGVPLVEMDTWVCVTKCGMEHALAISEEVLLVYMRPHRAVLTSLWSLEPLSFIVQVSLL